MATLKEKIISYLEINDRARSGDIATACAPKGSGNGRGTVSKTLGELVQLKVLSRHGPVSGKGYLYCIGAKRKNQTPPKPGGINTLRSSQVFSVEAPADSIIGKSWSAVAEILNPSAFDKWWNEGGFVEATVFAVDHLGRQGCMAAAKDFAIQQKEWLRSAFEAGVVSAAKEKTDGQ